MTWPGYEHVTEAQLQSGVAPAKPHKYRAQQVLVTDDLTIFRRDEILTLATQEGVATDRIRRGHARTKPLAQIAREIGIRGIVFASAREAMRWKDLRQRERAGVISDLRRQVPFDLHREDVVLAIWVADFTYQEDGQSIVEDAKGYRTREYRRKKKLFEQEYAPMKIRET